MEQFGIDQLEVIVDAAGEGINVGEKLLTGGGIFSAFALTDELAALGRLDTKAVVAQLKDVSQVEGVALRARFAAKVVLKNKALEAKLEGGTDGLAEAVEVVMEAVKVYQHALRVKDKFVALLG